MPDTQPAGATFEPAAQSAGARAAFLAALAHELRSPVAAIGYLAGLLAAETTGPRERSLAVTHIANSATVLARICTDLAELGRLERAGGPRPGTRIDVAAAVRRGVGEADLGGRRCATSLPALVAAVDRHAVERLVAILLEEAAARTPAGTTITVSLHRERWGVRLAVEDSAPWPGRPPRTRLGMMLARGFAEAHGGQLSSGPGPAGGTSVIVSLPAPPRPSTDPARP